ncbi:uncharacterized protein LOC106082916 [Stomoxys calcitrans]|uniref:Chitin-binding type-2 domain-containing protein n=1 Tax=Stomoxys calcitrans TaxID=35570 RepID=A0A1I8PXN7_STOCA|nr:uncharacterized protein LOC106082916 [Stomoxys calcitrans]
MKFFAVLAILACVAASGLACDADENNKPTCATDNVNVPIRNFWDPTAYWQCNASSGQPELVHCPDSYLFDSAKGQCVIWNEWEWTNPCPANN